MLRETFLSNKTKVPNITLKKKQDLFFLTKHCLVKLSQKNPDETPRPKTVQYRKPSDAISFDFHPWILEN